jgi:hypothetical protein
MEFNVLVFEGLSRTLYPSQDQDMTRPLQIHLSTAVVLMVTTSVLIGLNATPDIGYSPGVRFEPPFPGTSYSHYGFPLWYFRIELHSRVTSWWLTGLIPDVLFWIATIAGLCFVVEQDARRRKAQT